MTYAVQTCSHKTWLRIETLEKSSINYSFQIKTNLCALHSTYLQHHDGVGTYLSDETIHNVPLMDNFFLIRPKFCIRF